MNAELVTSALLARLDIAEPALAAHAAAMPSGLTAPDKGGDERWEASQVLAHIAEFIPYWIDQAQHVIDNYHSKPVPFGRTKADPTRRAAIAAHGEHDSLAHMARIAAGVAALRVFVGALTEASLAAVGEHPTLGRMAMPDLIEEFLVGHIEQHRVQLDRLGGA